MNDTLGTYTGEKSQNKKHVRSGKMIQSVGQVENFLCGIFFGHAHVFGDSMPIFFGFTGSYFSCLLSNRSGKKMFE